MSKMNISISTRTIAPQTAILDIQGEINGFAENALMGAYTEVSTNGAKNIILNFAGLEYMNSSGIGLLVTLLIRCNRQKQRLVAYNLTEHYRQIFDLTRLNEAISIYPGEAEAIRSVS